ncbi:MAG: hypothetical protein HY537_04080 [Deltaproteobacteria bacterium]|nr:hypothetical protein [Deltaproteobacteria bacterium]
MKSSQVFLVSFLFILGFLSSHASFGEDNKVAIGVTTYQVISNPDGTYSLLNEETCPSAPVGMQISIDGDEFTVAPSNNDDATPCFIFVPVRRIDASALEPQKLEPTSSPVPAGVYMPIRNKPEPQPSPQPTGAYMPIR